jgi:hypothetical protein
MFKFFLQTDGLFPMFPAFSLNLDDLVIEFLAGVDSNQVFVFELVA